MVATKKRDLIGLQKANIATACLLAQLAHRAQPGVTTGDLNTFADSYIHRIGGEPVFHTQNGFPACINTSVNDEAVHGVPGSRLLRQGDLLKIDCGIALNSYCGDATLSLGIGAPDRLGRERRAVMDVARETLRRGIAAVRVGGHVGDIGNAMHTYVQSQGFRLLRQYTGHGIGRRLWEAPSIPAVGLPGTGPRIPEGLVFTIEPIVVAGSGKTYVASDGWTVRTVDRAPAAQFEHTVIATRYGARILSLCPIT